MWMDPFTHVAYIGVLGVQMHLDQLPREITFGGAFEGDNEMTRNVAVCCARVNEAPQSYQELLRTDCVVLFQIPHGRQPNGDAQPNANKRGPTRWDTLARRRQTRNDSLAACHSILFCMTKLSLCLRLHLPVFLSKESQRMKEFTHTHTHTSRLCALSLEHCNCTLSCCRPQTFKYAVLHCRD